MMHPVTLSFAPPDRSIAPLNRVSASPRTTLVPPSICSPANVGLPKSSTPLLPSSQTNGVPAYPPWLVPSIVIGPVEAGNALASSICTAPPPPMSNFTTSGPATPFASTIASRSDPGPLSAALVKTWGEILDAGGLPALATSWELWTALSAGLVGALLSQAAFQCGPLGGPLAAMMVVDPVIGVSLGGIVFGESRRSWADRMGHTEVVYDERRPAAAPWSTLTEPVAPAPLEPPPAPPVAAEEPAAAGAAPPPEEPPRSAPPSGSAGSAAPAA